MANNRNQLALAEAGTLVAEELMGQAEPQLPPQTGMKEGCMAEEASDRRRLVGTQLLVLPLPCWHPAGPRLDICC